MSQLLLKLTFYLVTGVILSSITWSTLSHSAVTGDYALSVILLGMMFYVAGQFFVDRWKPEDGRQDFHAAKLWKIPHTTTRNGLWLRVAFSTAAHIAVYALLAFLLVLTTTARPAFMVLLGALFLLRIPHLYWSMRSKYAHSHSVDGAGASQTILHYVGRSRVSKAAYLRVNPSAPLHFMPFMNKTDERLPFIASDRPNYDDVIAFAYPLNPSLDLVKRVVGLPGDIIEVASKTFTQSLENNEY